MIQNIITDLCHHLEIGIDGNLDIGNKRVIVGTPTITLTDNILTISCDTAGASIYYTLDGSTPTSASTRYTTAVTLSNSCTIKAIAIKGSKSSIVVSQDYVAILTQWKIIGNSEVHTDLFLTSWKVSGNSEVHTLPYPDGVVLPNGYKRCEYLTFDGSSYINTGVKTANDIGYDFKCRTVVGRTLIGARTTAYSDGFVIGFFQSNNKLAVSYGGATSVTVATVNNYNDNGVHHIILDSVKLQIDDEVVDISSLRTTANTFLNIYLGTWNNDNTPDSRMWASDIYDTIIYNTQGELWHGIPCLDANGVPCFYDIVSQIAFYNQGSGSLTYKLYPQPTEIWSCGDLGQDGKYHVKISNGVNVFDIALTEPLRKVNDVADTIEFPSETEGKALVTRPLKSIIIGNITPLKTFTDASNKSRFTIIRDAKALESNATIGNIICTKYPTVTGQNNYQRINGVAGYVNNDITIYDEDHNSTAEDFKNANLDTEVIYELATPTTELVDVSPFPVSTTDTYTSANVVPYSAFEHTENKEIWSCGEYNATDGKYHILVQPNGGSIVDIALDEPLRRVNDISDMISYAWGVFFINRYLASFSTDKLIADRIVNDRNTGLPAYCKTTFTYSNTGKVYMLWEQANILCNKIKDVLSMQDAPNHNGEFIIVNGRNIYVRNTAIEQTVESYQSYFDSLGAIEIIYPLAKRINKVSEVSIQIQKAESYSMVISQGAKAVAWTEFVASPT